MIGNKPSIYNAQSVYNQGDKKTVWGGKPFEINTNSCVQITPDAIILKKPDETVSDSDSFRMAVEPIYNSNKKFNDLNIDDEIEINFSGIIKKLGSGRTFIFCTSSKFGSTSSNWNNEDINFEINNYDGKGWFKVFNTVQTTFSIDFNQIVRIHLFAKKTSSVTMSFIGWYNGLEKLNASVTLDSAALERTCLMTFGRFTQTLGFKTNSEIRPGSFIRYNNDILFGIK